MNEDIIQVGKYSIPVYHLNTAIVGTGAAGYNAADRLYQLGQHDIAIVTEGINTGTSRNTGSDKQTYYKLTLSGGDPDSVREMAETLFEGQCVDGDIALCEAALSSQGFLKLADLGVQFPRNRYGEYIGYKTDHDPRRRATSVGPYTSKMMTECLQKSVDAKNIKVFDRMQVIKVLVDGDIFKGLLCLNLDKQGSSEQFTAFICKNVIYATGGPAGVYADSVYPIGHYGATGIAFEAGVAGRNLTEWQYGLASTNPRWNVSGTYMQVLPKFVSTDKDGNDAREFLYDFFSDEGNLLDMVFLKGYQWPFDVRKVKNGSSIIDILVYIESLKGRRVFLDFRENPNNKPVDYSSLSRETREYLEKAGACFGTPLDRLLHMNSPAVDFYRDKGVDLSTQPLEIALCAQHNNGGLAVDCWWQTNIEGFFAAGEAAASHGVYRPGGSALNAGQVGSTRAAQYVAACRRGDADTAFNENILAQIKSSVDLADAVLAPGSANLKELWDNTTRRMSLYGGPIRNLDGILEIIAKTKEELHSFYSNVRIADSQQIYKAYRYYDCLLCQLVYLEAMADYSENGGKSRGSALYSDSSGEKPYEELPDVFTFVLDDGSRGDRIQEVRYNENSIKFDWRNVRPIPEDDDFFENVWRSYRENSNVY